MSQPLNRQKLGVTWRLANNKAAAWLLETKKKRPLGILAMCRIALALGAEEELVLLPSGHGIACGITAHYFTLVLV